jgi:hypothetical protein
MRGSKAHSLWQGVDGRVRTAKTGCMLQAQGPSSTNGSVALHRNAGFCVSERELNLRRKKDDVAVISECVGTD